MYANCEGAILTKEGLNDRSKNDAVQQQQQKRGARAAAAATTAMLS